MSILSVVVPVYKVEREYLIECLACIKNQTYTDYELVIMDDGAEADTANFLDEYAKDKENVKVYHQENAGVAIARNRAIDKCTGKYVTFIDCDDTIALDYFEKIVTRAQRDDLEVLMWGMYFCYGERKVEFSPYSEDIPLFDSDRLYEVQLKCMVGILPCFKKPATVDAAGSACAKLYRLDFLKDNNIKYVEGLKRAEDMLFNLCVFGKAKRVGYMYDMLYYYRQISTSATYSYRPGGINVFTDTLVAMGKYIEQYLGDGSVFDEGKKNEFMQVYYMRCMFFLLESMDMDYLNAANKKSFLVNRKELMQVASSSPYKEAIKKLDLWSANLVIARKIPLVLLRMRMIGVLMLFYKVYGLVTKR